MKCRVCGYELGINETRCPMCGTRAVSAARNAAIENAENEMSWNTKDFPKPKKPEDIDMNWGQFTSFNNGTQGKGLSDEDIEAAMRFQKPVTLMSGDATEGYISIPKEQRSSVKIEKTEPEYKLGYQPEYKPSYQPSYQQAQNQSYSNLYNASSMPQQTQSVPQTPQFETWTMPKQEVPSTPLWYTQNFTATGVMKTGPAYPLPQQPQAPAPMPPVNQPPVFEPAVPKPAYPGGYQQAMQEKQSQVPEPTIAYYRQPSYSEDRNQYQTSQAQKRPEQFYTFQQKNEEFQKLLDQEYERIRSMQAEDFIKRDTLPPSFNTQKPVKAQELSEFERMLMEGTKDSSEVPDASIAPQDEAPAKETASIRKMPVMDASPIFNSKKNVEQEKVLSEIASIKPVAPKASGSGYDIDTIEHTISELEAEELADEMNRSLRKKKLAAMAAARDAYFKSLDEELEINRAEQAAKYAAENHEQIEEAKLKKAEQIKRLEEQKKAEEARRLEEQKKAEEARRIEEQIKAEEARRLEEQKKAEQARALEEQRREEARLAEELRRAEEARFAEEQEKQAAAESAVQNSAQAQAAAVAAAQFAEIEAAADALYTSDATPIQIYDEPAKQDKKADTIFIQDNAGEAVEPTAKIVDEEKPALSPVAAELANLYNDDYKEQPKRKKGHPFLLFIFVVILIIAIFEGGVIALRHFLPGAEITNALTDIEQGVIDAISAFGEKLKLSVSSIVDNIKGI